MENSRHKAPNQEGVPTTEPIDWESGVSTTVVAWRTRDHVVVALTESNMVATEGAFRYGILHLSVFYYASIDGD